MGFLDNERRVVPINQYFTLCDVAKRNVEIFNPEAGTTHYLWDSKNYDHVVRNLGSYYTKNLVDKLTIPVYWSSIKEIY